MADGGELDGGVCEDVGPEAGVEGICEDVTQDFRLQIDGIDVELLLKGDCGPLPLFDTAGKCHDIQAHSFLKVEGTLGYQFTGGVQRYTLLDGMGQVSVDPNDCGELPNTIIRTNNTIVVPDPGSPQQDGADIAFRADQSPDLSNGDTAIAVDTGRVRLVDARTGRSSETLGPGTYVVEGRGDNIVRSSVPATREDVLSRDQRERSGAANGCDASAISHGTNVEIIVALGGVLIARRLTRR